MKRSVLIRAWNDFNRREREERTCIPGSIRVAPVRPGPRREDEPEPIRAQQPVIRDKGYRKRLTGEVKAIMAEWTHSPFEHEAECRHGLRRAFCEKGFDWHAADHEAARIVSEALLDLGAEGPGFDEGQWFYTISRDYCLRCHGPIDENDRTGGQRFCCSECARIFLETRASSETRLADTIRTSAYALVARHSRPAKSCAECGRPFHPADENTRFCSAKCRAIHLAPQQQTIPDINCAECGKLFHPKSGHTEFCSLSCAAKGRTKRRAAELPDRNCDWCGESFHPLKPDQHFCCSAHRVKAAGLADKLKRGTAILSPQTFDYVLRTMPPTHLTPAVFDAMLMAA
jgi:endogenous inhibitor of DNA gyrase (YacG/DUF329 family)